MFTSLLQQNWSALACSKVCSRTQAEHVGGQEGSNDNPDVGVGFILIGKESGMDINSEY